MTMKELHGRPRTHPGRAGTGSPRRHPAARGDGPIRHCEERSDEAIQQRHPRFCLHDRITDVHVITEAGNR